MNTFIDENIQFDNTGLCNHCNDYEKMMSSRTSNEQELNKIIELIKKRGNSKQYDCIIGVSGGVDSTYLAYLAKEKYKLNPLAIHFDNGWNSELAVSNIEKTLKSLDIDLYTYVMDWNEFKDIQLSFLKASVPDGEIPTDHAINALLWKEASKRNIKYILSGMNYKTESTSLDEWSYGHSDWRYIKNIHKKFGKKKFNHYPYYSFLYLFYVTFVKRIRQVSLLNYENYDNQKAIEILEKKLGWIYYGGKHYESIYTRWYQGYFLKNKFNIDKRYLHYSNLIKNNNMNKSEALKKLEEPAYDEIMQNEDTEYVLKKLNISKEDFKKLFNSRVKSFHNYKNSFTFVSYLKKLVNLLRFLNLYPK